MRFGGSMASLMVPKWMRSEFRSDIITGHGVNNSHQPTINCGRMRTRAYGINRRARGAKMASKQRSVKSTPTVLLPIQSFQQTAVKNKSPLLLTKTEIKRKRPPRKIIRMAAVVFNLLLDFDLRPSRFDLFLDLLGFLLGHTFLDWFGSAFDQCFRLGQSKAWHCAANLLNHADLVRAHFLQNDVKCGFLFRRRCCCSAASRWSRCHRNRCGRAYAPFFFELFYQASNLENGQSAELLHQFICVCHFFPPIAVSESFRKIEADSHRPGQCFCCLL